VTAVPAIAIIPVRVESQRLPRKALLAESGQPLFLHTWQQAATAFGAARAFVATDSDEVAAAAETAGAPVVRTSATPRTGSERVAEACQKVHVDGRALADDDIVINVQGDWPEVEPGDLVRLAEHLHGRPGAATATLAAPLTDPARIAEPDVVKVVRGRGVDDDARFQRALYFSRSPIPFARSADVGYLTLRHIGVYAFKRRILALLGDLPSSGLAEFESLEQLRLLENGIEMAVLDATGDPWGIETRTDYDAFLKRHERGRQP
jgi:3-deoxy-manno-octulosonate cytidylyltransferase (CMP-KDO synthetase)